ncbi:uncharacterized protein DMENIID0001_079420 [Sergentomyia squamirostris]
MANFIGTIEAYLPGENFVQYRSRMDHLLEANDVDDTKKARLCCTFMGPLCYDKLVSLLAPATPKEKSYKEIMDILEQHFRPINNVIAERCKFFSRNRQDGEKIEDYIVELKALANECQFGEFLMDSLRDRLVSGVNDDKIQAKLLMVKDLKWETASQMCLAEEMTRRNVKEMSAAAGGSRRLESDEGDVHRIQQRANFRQRARDSGRRKEGGRQDTSDGKFPDTTCTKCGFKHERNDCRARNTNCNLCGKRGHWAAVCWSKDPENCKIQLNTLHLSTLTESFNYTNPLFFTLRIDNTEVVFEVDSGAVCTVMGSDFLREYFPYIQLEKTDVKLSQASGDPAIVEGCFRIRVSTGHSLPIYVIRTTGKLTPLLGRDWLDVIFPGWRDRVLQRNIKLMTSDDQSGLLSEIKKYFPRICDDTDKSPIEGFEAEIHLKDDAIPIFFKSRETPLSVKDKVGKKLEQECAEDLMEPVRHSKWASPIVVVPKGSDGIEIRICGDFSVTINKHIETEHYPLPQIEELLAMIAGAGSFCSVDMKSAFQQIKVSESSREFLTINTPKGLFRYKRLPFGVSSAPSIFQSIMDQILVGISGVACYLDDLLIFGPNDEEVKKTLWEVFKRLNDYNVKINLKKCQFFKREIKFLGHIISSDGVRPNPEKLRALENAPQPKDLKQLQAFLGLMNYYGKFIHDLADKLRPLYDLLMEENRDGDILKWEAKHTQCFEMCKQLLTSESILTHYDPRLDIVLAVDASPDGLGAVLSHVFQDGTERPVFFASRTLTDVERNYSQLDKEAAAIIYGIKRYYKFVYGHRFVIYTDHKPLISIFDPKKNNGIILSERMQRWQAFISNFNCKIIYRPGKNQGNCDGLSRLPIQDQEECEDEFVSLKGVRIVEGPLNYEIVRAASRRDREILQLKDIIMRGWPENINQVPENIKDYWRFRASLSVEDDCVYYGVRIVIPRKLRRKALHILHDTHIGMVRMKMMARSLLWWKGLDTDIEDFASECETCCMTARRKPQKTTKWPETTYPFERIYLDFCHFAGKEILVTIDSYSKWVELKVMKNITAGEVKDNLEDIFSRMGAPKQLVSDNGPPFSSSEFIEYCKGKNIEVLKSPPYHPESNGLCERAVQTMKNALKREMIDTNFPPHLLSKKLVQILKRYNHAPSTVTQTAPAELVYNFVPKTDTNSINPHFRNFGKIKKNLSRQDDNVKQSQSEMIRKNQFNVNDEIWYRCNAKDFVKWVPGTVVKVLSPVRYTIAIGNNLKQAHHDQLKKYKGKRAYHYSVILYGVKDEDVSRESESDQWDTAQSSSEEDLQPVSPELRRSRRIRRPPRRLTYGYNFKY